MSHIYAVTPFDQPLAHWPLLAAVQAKSMLALSQYWQPERVEQLQTDSPSALMMGQILRFNTPYSHHEKVHCIGTDKLYVVANARLDNRQLIFQLLNMEADANIADGLLIGYLYQRFNTDCLTHLLGDFAFIIWDAAQQQLFAACDHFGVKNLFYGQCDLGLIISNEHKALVTAPGIDNRINPDYLVRQWLTLPDVGYVSPCAGIKAIPPAHYLLASAKGVECKRYWQLHKQQYAEFASMEQSIAGLRQRLELAVKRRLLSGYPIGAELSEGIDSTAITAIAAQTLAPTVLPTFSYDSALPNTDNAATYNEIFDFVALYPNIQPQWQNTTKAISDTELTQAIAEAFAAPVPMPGQWLERYPLVQGCGIRTLLSGWGGDHCVSSPAHFYDDELFRQGKWFSLLQLARKKYQRGSGGHPAKVLPRLLLKYVFPRLYKKRLWTKSAVVRHFAFIHQSQPLKPDWVSKHHLDQSNATLNWYDLDSVEQRDWRELFDIGVHWRLFGSEITGRFFGIDYRFPLLDLELVQYVYSMPSAYKISQGVERSMFRDAIAGLVTERIRTRLKFDVVMPAGLIVAHKNKHKAQLIQLTSELQAHPIIQHFFAAEAFEALPQRFVTVSPIAKKMVALQALCKLYDQGLLRLPAKRGISKQNENSEHAEAKP